MRILFMILVQLMFSSGCIGPHHEGEGAGPMEFEVAGVRARYTPPPGARELMTMAPKGIIKTGKMTRIAVLEIEPAWYSGGLPGVTILVGSFIVPECTEMSLDSRFDFARRRWGTGPDKLGIAGYRSGLSNPNEIEMTPVGYTMTTMDVAGVTWLRVEEHLASDQDVVFSDSMIRPMGGCGLFKLSASYRLLSWRDRRAFDKRQTDFLDSLQSVEVIAE